MCLNKNTYLNDDAFTDRQQHQEEGSKLGPGALFLKFKDKIEISIKCLGHVISSIASHVFAAVMVRIYKFVQVDETGWVSPSSIRILGFTRF